MQRHGSVGPSLHCTVELFGVARLVANAKEVCLPISPQATLADALEALAEQLPVLVGRVIGADRRSLVEGYACNVNGLDFVRSAASPVHQGDSIVILSADAGG
jgi:molybdopterin converting factor small subunit